jgi:hypothetical protein
MYYERLLAFEAGTAHVRFGQRTPFILREETGICKPKLGIAPDTGRGRVQLALPDAVCGFRHVEVCSPLLKEASREAVPT